MDKLKKKAKEVYNNKNKKLEGKKSMINYLGENPNEYPGTNKKYLEENTEKWNEYYQCLNTQNDRINSQEMLTPEALIGFETSSVTLECKLCLSPFESENKDSIIWEWAFKNSPHLTPIEYTEHILLSPENRALEIYNLNHENTGQYSCRLLGASSSMAPYFLTIVNISEDFMNSVHSDAAPSGPYGAKIEEIVEYNLILDTEWSEWSRCSKCGAIGRRHKFGYCIIFQKENSSENEFSSIFRTFKYGIPCQSHILPEKLQENAKIKSRKNEIMSGFCNEKCPTGKIYEIRDKNGNIIEQADNSKGIYSLTQKLPPLEPTVERKLQFEAKGTDIILECPGNCNNDAPILWQIGEKNLIPEEIAKESNGRIYISITDRIHIKKAKILDSNIYSCWQLNELAGTIRLVIEKKFELNFNHTIMLGGIVIILGTFLYVFLKVLANNNNNNDLIK